MRDTFRQLIPDALHAVGASTETYLNQLNDHEPTQGSIARNELDSRYGGSEPPGDVGLAHSFSYITIGITSDCLRAAGRLLDPRNPPANRYAISPVLRTSLETSGLLFWLARHDVAPRERLVRALRLAEYSRRMRAKSDSYFSAPGDTEYLEAIRRNVRAIAGRFKLKGLSNQIRENSDISIPTSSDLIRKQFEEVTPETFTDALALYGRLSEPTHGNILGTLAGYEQATDHENPRAWLVPKIPLVDIAAGAHYAAEALSHSGATYFQLIGWTQKAGPPISKLRAMLSCVLQRKPLPWRLSR